MFAFGPKRKSGVAFPTVVECPSSFMEDTDRTLILGQMSSYRSQSYSFEAFLRMGTSTSSPVPPELSNRNADDVVLDGPECPTRL